MAFHVPEPSRVRRGRMATNPGEGKYGAFDVPSPEPGWHLAIVADDGTDPDVDARWEHVSVHAYRVNNERRQRTPTWAEMCFIKSLFWDAEDIVMQLHPRASEYVNQHPHTLHLWRPLDAPIPEPPTCFVGV